MADKNTYRLIIEVGDGGSASTSPIASGENQGASDKTGKTGIGLLTVYSAIQPFIQKTENMVLNNVQTNTGSSEITQRTQIAMNVVNFAVKTGVSVLSGMSIASALGVAGPIGAAIGAAIAIGTSVFNYISNANEINNKRLIENEQLSVLRGRAGIQYNRSRGGE
jgi:hypothetical protein